MRMSSKSQLSDPAYVNWLRDTLALLYLKEGVESITNALAAQVHDALKLTIGDSTCTSCSHRDMIKDSRGRRWYMNCPVCNAWLQQIISNHGSQPLPNIHRDNTNPQRWPSDPWEVLKCYMGHGCQGIKSAKDTDTQNILTLFKNCKKFASFGQIRRMDLVDNLLKIRNSLFHSGSFLVAGTTLQTDIQTMLDFLTGLVPKSPVESKEVTDAMRKISESSTIDLSLASNRDLELRALKQKQNALDLKQQELEQEHQILNEATNVFVRTLQEEQQELRQIIESRINTRSSEDSHRLTENNITHLRTELKVHYLRGQSLLVPNPVVDEALDLDEIYVRPDIKVLRETPNPRAGLKLLHDNSSTGNHRARHKTVQAKTSQGMCKSLFYTENYQNKQIYVTGNAGVWKTVLCKYLVNLLCQTDTVSHSNTLSTRDATSSQKKGPKRQQKVTHCMIPVIRVDPPNADCVYPAPSEYEFDHNRNSAPLESSCNKGAQYSAFITDTLKVCLDSDSDAFSSDAEEDSHSAYSGFSKLRLEKEDKKIMTEFRLVFYISLRESSKHYTVTDMIDAQILKHIRGSSHLKAADILQNWRCLVIIDGLDEWATPEHAEVVPSINPGIPARDFINKTVFLTTTRPWKLEVLGLKGLEIDKHVELCGLNESSSKELCSKYIDFVNKIDGTNKMAHSFSFELQKRGLQIFNNVPNLLILLIGLWMDNQDLDQSRLHLFCSMLEMLLKRAAGKNLPQQRPYYSINTDKLLPQCFINRVHCQIHEQLLQHLCKVAFESLLSSKQEDTLVFNTAQLSIFGIDKEWLDLCLKSGILTQDKVLGKRSVTEKKISFLHKQLQELLAAVYISNRDNTEDAASRICDFCTSVESVLELSQVWMFVSGIIPDLARELLVDLLTRIVLNDIRLKDYRQDIHRVNVGLVESISTCIVECVMEAKRNDHRELCLPLYDFIIDNNTISACLEYMVITNISVVKSVYINTRHITGDDVQTVMRILGRLQHTRCLLALYLDDYVSVIFDMSPLHTTLINNTNTLTSLVLCNLTLSTELCAALCGFVHHLTSLSLWNVSLTHEQGKQLLSSLQQADMPDNIKVLELSLHCTDHRDQCRPMIDMSGHTQLHRLSLWRTHVEKLPMVTPSMKEIELQNLTIGERQLRQFIHQLSSNTHSVKVQLLGITVTGGNEYPVDLTDLKHNDTLHVKCTCCDHDAIDNIWYIDLSTQQETTSESDK